MFEPKLVTCLREGISGDQLRRDLLAGLVVGIVALPLALAFAIASGVPPERGLYTAIIAGFVIALLSGSRVQIGGPTGAFVVVVYGIVARFGYEGLVLCTMMAGVILVVLGFSRLGALIKFIPYPVITGFTSGIAVIIFASQLRDLFGLDTGPLPAHFLSQLRVLWSAAPSFNPAATVLGVLTVAFIVYWPRISTKIPGPFLALVVATLVVHYFALPVDTIGSRFGEIPSSLPSPELPRIPWGDLRELVPAALTIALLAAIESLLCAVVADGMIGTRHKSNMELVAQGVANFVSPIFGGIPATGAIARTATNVKAGGRTPIAGITHAIVLLVILMAAGKWAAFIPLPVLAAVLVVVAWHMSQWRSFRALLRAPRSDVIVLLLTFFLTILVDLTVAVQVGVVVAALLFMKRMAEVTNVRGVTDQLEEDEGDVGTGRRLRVPPGVELFEVNGPFFFGAADKLRNVMGRVTRAPEVLIFRMRNVSTIDATGLHALQQVASRSRAEGTTLLLAEVPRPVLRMMVNAGFVEELGRDNFMPSVEAALARAEDLTGALPVEPLGQ
jgi:sulfate permease, SulP family